MSQISMIIKGFYLHNRSVLSLWVINTSLPDLLGSRRGDDLGRWGRAPGSLPRSWWGRGHNRPPSLTCRPTQTTKSWMKSSLWPSTFWTWHFLMLQQTEDKVNLVSKGGGREAAQGWRALRAGQGWTGNSGVARFKANLQTDLVEGFKSCFKLKVWLKIWNLFQSGYTTITWGSSLEKSILTEIFSLFYQIDWKLDLQQTPNAAKCP